MKNIKYVNVNGKLVTHEMTVDELQVHEALLSAPTWDEQEEINNGWTGE